MIPLPPGAEDWTAAERELTVTFRLHRPAACRAEEARSARR